MEKLYIKRLHHTIALTLSLAGGLYHMAWAAPEATALPTGEQDVTNATVARDTANPVMTIEQAKGKNRAFISWDTFNIGSSATVNIKQYSGADLLVNAVRGSEMSQIAGKLNATGNVALINPNGVIFMDGAKVNVGGLGVYATGYDATNKTSVGINNSGNEGKIEIQSGATINAGVSAVLANLSALNIDPSDYAIAIDSTGESGYTNRIHLVAEGNVEIHDGATIKAKDSTYVGTKSSVGEEGFNVGVGAAGISGKIYIRSDRDADDYGSVIITHGENTNKPVMQSANGVSIYTNAAQVDGDTTKTGINAAVSRTESGDGATTTYYTKHDYKTAVSYDSDIDGSAYTDGTSVSVEGPGTTADNLSNTGTTNVISTSYAGSGKATTTTTALLVNNIDQLQDIEDSTYGNLDGNYVLGRDITATSDEHSYIDDGVLYKKNSDGTVKKWSTADGVEITGTKSGGTLSKTVDGTTIGYDKSGNKATTTLSDGTILSNSNGTAGAENTQWSTTAGSSTVTDKTNNSTYTISDSKVANGSLTSDTSGKTVTDGSYTADITNNKVTHTSDSIVTNTSAGTVTKPADTSASDAGYTAKVTDGTADSAGKSGTIAIKDITYTVNNGTVSDTVQYGTSSVTPSTKTVTADSVKTIVTADGTGTDATKSGTVGSSTIAIDGTKTTVTPDGGTSYTIVAGTDASQYTKGTTDATISGKTVTVGDVSSNTDAGTVTQGSTTATITSSTAGTVVYGGKSYTVDNGAVSLTDDTTGTVSDTVKESVLTFFQSANTALTTAKGIYSDYTADYAAANSLATTLNSSITTLQDVAENATDTSTVQSTFESAASRLQSDTAFFMTASTALTDATTALAQYKALQSTISSDTATALAPSLEQAYSEFQSDRLDDTTINDVHSDKWNDGKGFDPLGDSTTPFTGSLDGFSGEKTFGISNLTINRSDEDNVGLVGVAGTSGNGASFGSIHLYDAAIAGKNNVGAIAGTLQAGSTISWSSVSGTVTGSNENIGGLAGLADASSIWDSSNSATVTGTSADGTDKKIGGIAGTISDGSTLTDVRNFGAISGTEDVGGIAGYVDSSTILGSTDAVNTYYNTYNNGSVTGTTDTGGIVGHAKGIYMYGAFNTNEDSLLSKHSQLIIDDSNKITERGDGTTTDKDKLITDTSLQSSYGKVTGVTNTGGLVGFLEDAPDFTKTVTNINVSSTSTTDADGNTEKKAQAAAITNNVIDTGYNAGNITGTGENTGGLVGKMTGGTLSNVYNADNNTVLREVQTLPMAITGFNATGKYDGKTYAYSANKAADCNNQTLTDYYSFFTVGKDSTRTYYYFIPVATTSGTTQKGAGGIYVTADGTEVASADLPATRDRYYFNRTFNKDANVTGAANTGGLVGSMTTTSGTTPAKYSAGSVIDSAYNAGKITGSSDETTGALVGAKDDASVINDSFYVTGTDAANGNTYSNVSQAVGTKSSQSSGIANTSALDSVNSKKKYYVSDDGKRTNFPGVQQKTLTEKDSSTTYYEYTSGTAGTFYTDGTGKIDSISKIYPVTTTGTTDSSGNTTYTSSRSTTPAYTKQSDGKFLDASGNTYTATYDATTRQIVLTPTDTTKAATVVLNAVLAARSANETWTIYEDQTRPLLTAFLNTASLSRTFTYDGTTHNLKTDDVADLYGRADFDGNAGKDVQLSNYQLSSNGVSSEYTYDNTSIWSPQHGYFMDPESTLVINPVDMSANLYGTRVYGDIFNTRGYYVCVPYTENSVQKYSFYKPSDDGTTSYTLLKDTALTDFFGNDDPTEDNLLKIAEKKGFYVLELDGFINGEGVNNLGELITGLVTTLSNSSSTSSSTTTSGNDLQHLFSDVTADTYLDAGIYNVSSAQITGLTATNQNYTINYGGQLTVKQAELYYTYDGSRTYGLQNTDSSATHAYTLVGVDSDEADENDKYTSTHGLLKYWDLTGKTITIENADGTTTTIDNPYQYFFTSTDDGYEINQDYIGVTGYTAQKTTTTTDVTTGSSTTTTTADETKSASLDDIYKNMKGTANDNSINLPSTDSTTTSKTIGSYGTGAVSNDMYTHVLVDKDGNPLGYKVTSFASTNETADGTIQLYFKTNSGTDADKVTQAAVDKFNQNYKLVWKEGGTYDKVYTVGNPEKSTTADDAGIQTTTDGLTVNDSTFTILPKTATVTITGNREYGDTMGTSSYTTTTKTISTGDSAAGLDTTAGTYNINIDGLTNSDTASVLDSTKTESLLKNIDKADRTVADAKATNEINKYTNVVRDNSSNAVYQDISGFADSTVSVVNGDASTDKMKVTSTTTTTTTDNGTTSTTTYDNPDSILTANNYDYILQDGTHQLKITPVSIKVTVNGSKTYGDFTSQAATDYTASVSGGVTVAETQAGKVTLKTGEVADIVIANNLNEQSNAGEYKNSYSYSSSSPASTADVFTISLADDTANANTDKNDYDAANYDVSFSTTYTIGKAPLWYTYEGTRDYGADNTSTASTFKLVGIDGTDSSSSERVRGFLKSWDAATYGVGSDKTISLMTVGDDKASLYTMTGMANDAANKKDATIRSITSGNSSDTYSHVIVDSTGKVIGYNLSTLGLASNDKLSLEYTTKNEAFKNNYELVWKPQVQAGTDGTGSIQSTQTTTASVKDATTGTVSTNSARTVNVGASTLTINPVALTVEVTGKREYGHTMGNSYNVSTNADRAAVNTDGKGTVKASGLTNETYNINLDGLKNNDGASVLDDDAVKALLSGVDTGDSTDATKISRYTSVKQSGKLATDIDYQGEKVYAFDLTKKSGNADYTGSQITVTGKTGTVANHYDLLAANNYDYTLQDGTHTLTIDRHDLNLNVQAERQYGDISNQKVVSDYKSDAKQSGTTPSYATGITSDTNGLQNGETIDFTKSTVNLSSDFYKADAGMYTHNWYNDDNSKGTDYSIGNKGITDITLVAGDGSNFDPKNYNIHYTTTYTIDKADLYYTYDGERNYGQDNSAATHTYTIVGKDADSSAESVRSYLKSWDSGVLSGGNVLNNDLLKVANTDGKAYTMTGVAIQDADTTVADNAVNVTDPKASQSIGKDSGYSHVIVDKDGKILSYTLDSLGTEIAGKDATGTLVKNYNLVWKQGGDSHQLDKVYTASGTSTIDANGVLQATSDTENKITVNNSSFKIDPLSLTVTVTGQRDYGDSMDAQKYTVNAANGRTVNGEYNINVSGTFGNNETAGSILDDGNVKEMLASLENDKTTGDNAATRENSNGASGKISKYTNVKRNADDKSKIDSYDITVGSTDTSSTVTLATVTTKDGDKVTSLKHADKNADSKTNGFNVLSDNNYDYVVKDGAHMLTINPVDLTVDVKGTSTYGTTDTKTEYTVTSVTGAKNGETPTVGSETKSNLAANAAAGSYTTDAWNDKTGAETSKAATDAAGHISGKYLTTTEVRADKVSSAGTSTDKGIYQVQLVAGKNTDGSGLSTFDSNNYNITYHAMQVINPEKLTITIAGTKVYGSQPTALGTGNMTITSGALASGDSLAGLTIANNMAALTDVGVYSHNWSQSAGAAGGKIDNVSYTYKDASGTSHTSDSAATSWITGVSNTDSTKFDFNNYDVDFQLTYDVMPRPLNVDVSSTSVYGDARDSYVYTATALSPTVGQEGLVNGQQFNATVAVNDDIDATTDAGTYTHTADGTSYSDASGAEKVTDTKGITAVTADSFKDAGNTGFKSSNYAIRLNQGTHTVTKRTVRATVSGSQVYGESAPSAGEAYDIAFTMAGGNGVATYEGLANGQTIANSQVTVQNSVGMTNDVGIYTSSQSDVGAAIAYGNNPERVDGKDQGIYGLTVADSAEGMGFKNNNYNIVLQKGSYEVTKRPVTFLTTGSRTYGDVNTAVEDYQIQQQNTRTKEGLTGRNAGTVTVANVGSSRIGNITETTTDADVYGTQSNSTVKQVLDIDPAVQEILGDDYKNYAITYQDKFTINPRTVRVTIAGESTYGDAAQAAGTDYQTIAFEQAGVGGVASHEGLANGETIDKSQVRVLTDGIGKTTNAGTYHLSQGDGKSGISGITVEDGNGFKNNNYKIVIEGGTYTVKPRDLKITIKGEKTYGDATSFSGKDYEVSQEGLQNNEKIDFGDATVLHSAETDDRFSNASKYRSSDGKGILGFDKDTLHGEGFRLGNYTLDYDTVFVIDKRPVDVYMESRRTSGSPSSLRMDEPMAMRNVPQEHQGRFLSDMQVLDTAPQVIAAGDYPGEDGKGYLDLSFAGDIYSNYMIHRHTVYHILPDRMMKPSVYNAVQPVRRPILDVMYLKVNGSEGINRWSGVEASKDDGAIILKDGLRKDGLSGDSTGGKSQPNQPNQPIRPDQPTRPADGMGDFREEVNQAVPVVYTDGENKELGGRYHLAYENDAVVVRPTADTAEVPTLREASVAQESHKTLRVPYQGTQGEYAVAYADGIVQLYPKNDAARQLAQAKGGDEQLLLRSGLDSAVQQLGIQLEDVEAVYIFTK